LFQVNRNGVTVLSTVSAWGIARALPTAIALIVAAWPAAAAADGSGIVAGVVTNGTAGGTVPAGLPVTLTRYVAGVAVETIEGQADADGNFRFEELETDPQVVYQVQVEYLATRFAGDPFSLSGSERAEVEIEIFEVTATDPGIEIARHVIVYTPASDKGVRALEILTLTNPSDRAFVFEQDETNPVLFSLARGAFDFVVMIGFEREQVEFVENGVSIRRPLSPGANQISFAYSFPWRLEGIDIPRRAPFRTLELVVMGPAGELAVGASRIERTGDVTIEGRNLWVWRNAEPVPAGAEFSLNLKDPSPSAASRFSAITSAQWGIASIAVALGSLGAYSAIRFGRSDLGPKRISKEDRARALLESIARSGDDVERRVYKDELIKILESDDRLAKKLLGGSEISD
jgi:hypothetical protein